jgi:ankyrin repeat protein
MHNIIMMCYLNLTASKGRNNIVDLLVTHAASLVEPDNHGMTPIHEAAYKNQERTYHILGKYPQFDGSLKDALGYTPDQHINHVEKVVDHNNK